MLVFLFGKDTFRSRQKLGEILQRYSQLPKAKRNLRFLDCAEMILEDVQKELTTSSLFQEKKLLVLKNVFQNKDFADTLFEQREALAKNSDTVLFFEEGEILSHPLFSFLKKHAKSQEFKPLSKAGTLTFANKELEKYGKTAAQDALLLLVGETGNNLWRLSQEILKLAAFLGKRASVHKEDVKNLLCLSLEADIFATLQAIALQDRAKALELLSLHIKQGDEPLRILSTIATQLRRAPAAKLEQSFEKVFEADKNIKTGRVKPASALYLFAAQA